MNGKNIEEILKKLSAEDVPPDMHRVAEETSRNFSKTLTRPRQYFLWEHIVKSRMTKVAVAAGIIIAIGLFVNREKPNGQTDGPILAQAQKSPAELLTAMSLNIAYRRGGIEAVEKQSEQALKMLGPRPEPVSIRKMLAELTNNESSERTKL